MYCSNCGNQVPEGSAFCLKCGNQLGSKANEAPKKSSGGVLIVVISIGAIVLILIVALIIGLTLYYQNESKRRLAEINQRYQANEREMPIVPQVEPVRPPKPVMPQGVSVVDKTFPVGARQFVYYTIPLSAATTHLTGHFTAQGGANDIEVFVFDQDGFTNFSNKHSAKTFYSSGGYVTTGSIDLQLPSGTYYVVFNNSDSILTNKVVTAKIESDAN
jgi:hypothetical protein